MTDPEEEDKGPSNQMLWLIGAIFFAIICAVTIVSESGPQKSCEEEDGVFLTSYRGPSECIAQGELNGD